MSWTEEQALAQSLRAEERGNEFFEEGLEHVAGRQEELRRTEKRRKHIEKGLGSAIQLEHGGIVDYQADEGPGYRIALQKLAGVKLSGADRKAKRAANQLFKQSYKAAAAGDFETADALRAQALESAETAGLLGEGGAFELGEKFGPKKMKGYSYLMSEQGLHHGQIVADARALMDPDSERSEEFRRSLTDGALAAIDAAEEVAGRALATQERSAARGIRDLALSAGGARAVGAESAIAARSAERFAGQRADLALQAGAARVQVESEAARYFEAFRREWAVNAPAAARAWLNDLSFVRDSYNQMQNDLTGMFAELSGAAGAANLQLAASSMSTAGSIHSADRQAAAQEKAAKQQMWGSIIGGVLGIAGMFL